MTDTSRRVELYKMNTDDVTTKHVLVVDDEADIVALVAYHLAKEGFRVSTAADGKAAVAQITKDHPDLVVLDEMLPGMSGFEVLERIRADAGTTAIPVLMLTARKDESDRIRGLSLGADDYLTKPFSPRELVLRVKAILRRSGARNERDDVIRVGDVSINRSAHTVANGGQPVDLTPTEYKLLILLAERRGRVQGRSNLLQSVWDAAPDIQTRTVDMHVQRLRTKLGASGDLIETVRGFGYRIRPGGSAET
ncbi:MAG TPA: response regulator transcription factor [Gemmatimonadaceae bacterium]|nr:response regulator transcription factor [Gemmatimonadaceae bacterium]